ncbi:MAG: flagellar hook-length control protein FliK [Hyphomicrobiales bacterium]|nr:flagellar hook-length control protein FliK [Hyphomicrobiales bacterium]
MAATRAAEPAQRRASPNSAVAQDAAPGAAAKAQAAANPNAAQGQTPEAGTQNDAATVAAPAKKAASATAQAARAPTAGQQAPAAAQAGQQQQQGDNAAGRQASDLSNRLGGKTNAQVSVTVEDDGAAVASQPRTSIAAPTVAGANGKPGTGTGQGRNGRTAAAGQANAASQQAAAQAGAQAPVQVQSPAPAAAAGAAKAAGPVAVQSVSAGAAAGGGEALGPGNAGTTGEARQAQHTAAAQNPKAATAQRPPVVEQVSVHIAKAVRAGVDRIHIQLKPESMGRVDVHMEIAKDGRVSAVVTVDNRETLNALQKDSHTLEQALRDAGLQADSDDLQFNLRGEQGGEGGDSEPDGRLATGEGGETAAEAEPDGDAADRLALLLARARGLANRIDIRA